MKYRLYGKQGVQITHYGKFMATMWSEATMNILGQNLVLPIIKMRGSKMLLLIKEL